MQLNRKVGGPARWLCLALGAVVTACGETMIPSTPVSAAVTLSPAPGALAVPRNAAISMTASIPMDSATCLGRMQLRLGDSTGALIPAHMSFTDDHRGMMLHPDTLLEPLTRYWMQVSDSMMGSFSGMMGGGSMMGTATMSHSMRLEPSAGAMRMAGGIGWTFTTGP